MPICDRCGKFFNVEEKPGALLFSHPRGVKKAEMVKKYHLCQKCEEEILSDFMENNHKEESKMKTKGQLRKEILNDFGKTFDIPNWEKDGWKFSYDSNDIEKLVEETIEKAREGWIPKEEHIL